MFIKNKFKNNKQAQAAVIQDNIGAILDEKQIYISPKGLNEKNPWNVPFKGS